MITVASLLWDANENSESFSTMYDESWVVKLYNGFARNITLPWRFVLFTDRLRGLPEGINQETLRMENPDYSACVEPFRYGCPMILCGLDTIVLGSVDHLAEYCLNQSKIALPRDPYDKTRSCNGVVLIPAGHQGVYRNWPKGENDMVYMRKQDHDKIDDLFPGQVVSYKGYVREKGLEGVKMVYFHGSSKPHELNDPWIKQHWR